MTNIRRIAILLAMIIIASATLCAQSNTQSSTQSNTQSADSQNKSDEKTVEESYLQEAIELMIIRETSQSASMDQKLLALQYIGEAIDRGNTSDDIRQALEYLSMEGLTNQARENGRMVNNFPLVRREAARYLGKLGTPEAQAALINICKYEPEPMVLQEAIKALGDNASENSDKALDAIVWITGRFDVLNPDNLMALAAVDSIAKIADKGGFKTPGAAALLIRIADGPYIKPVQNRAKQVLSDLRKVSSQQNKDK